MDSILDWVPKMIERTPGVLVAVLGVYQVVLIDDKLGMTKEFIGKSPSQHVASNNCNWLKDSLRSRMIISFRRIGFKTI